MRCVLVLLLSWPCHPAGALSLSELEGEIDAGLAIQIAEVEVDRAGYVLAERKSERGLKVLSNVALSDNVEPSDVGGTRAFRALSAQLGFRYPLLGSRWREEVAELGAATEAAVAEIRRDIAFQQALLTLRLSYLDYWLAERKAALSADILRREPEAGRTLEQRRDAGLLLESDRRELMTAFALARRNQATARTTADHALARVNLTGRSRVPFRAEFPKLPAACHDAAAFPAAIADAHPEIAVFKTIAEAKADHVYFSATAPIESGVNVTQSVVYESTDQSGYGTVLSFDVRMPLDLAGVLRAIRDEAAAARIRAGLELELRRRELSAEALRTLGAYEARLAQNAFIREREAAVEEAIRERGLRAAAALPGDAYEKLEQAHIDMYRVALKAAAAQAGLAIEEARLLAFAPHGCDVRSPAARPARASTRLKDRRPRFDHVGFVPPSPRTLP